MIDNTIAVRLDRQLEPFVSMFPRAELKDPISARKRVAELSAKVQAPDIEGMELGTVLHHALTG